METNLNITSPNKKNMTAYYIIDDNSGFPSANYLSHNLKNEEGIIIISKENDTSAED